MPGPSTPGPGAWRYGAAIVGRERRRLVAAFNGGFRLNTNTGGWESYGRTAVPLTDGLASIVTYRDGTKLCWGATLGGGASVARAAIGITARRKLVWAGVSSTTPATLARAMISAGVVRAAELDINPAWVAGYLYRHGTGPLGAIPVVPGRFGVSGRFLRPYTRDSFSVLGR